MLRLSSWALLPALLVAPMGCKEEAAPAKSTAATSASAAPSAAPVKRARFAHRPVSVGQKWQSKRKSQMKISVEFWTETARWATVESFREEEIDFTDEIRKRVGGWPGEVLTTYAVHHLVEDHPDKGKRDDRFLEGRSFILNRLDEKPIATDADGKELSEEEYQTVWTHHVHIGKEDELVSILEQRPIPVGRKYPLKDFMFKALIGVEMGEYKSGYFTITSVDEQSGESVATFSWTAETQTKEQNGMVLDWEMEGKTRIALEPARLISQDVEGEISIGGRSRKEGKWLRIEGAGTMSDHRELSLVK